MSRIGKNPVAVPAGVKVAVNGAQVTVEGPKGKLQIEARPEVTVTFNEGDKEILVTRANDERASKALHGTTRSLIQNMVTGVTDGFKKDLEINGVGWKAQVKGMTLELNVGYADTRKVDIPAGVDVKVDGARILVSGPDKQAVGQFAAKTRAHRKPEPYNGKGIKYADEQIIRKAGKAFAGGG
ncbi:MAG: 50S ribosomal protein L6 [Planctomycetota bacterium]|jgi:large subunit ribosomal protein L6